MWRLKIPYQKVKLFHIIPRTSRNESFDRPLDSQHSGIEGAIWSTFFHKFDFTVQNTSCDISRQGESRTKCTAPKMPSGYKIVIFGPRFSRLWSCKKPKKACLAVVAKIVTMYSIARHERHFCNLASHFFWIILEDTQ
jgi:hypothetical protein